LITRLSRIPSLVVRPTGSILKYAAVAKDPAGAARELTVDFVLDGSIRRSGDRIRISVQLVGAATGGALWAETFDERLDDIFAVEDSISARVADALALRLSGEEQQSIAKHGTDNPEAYHLYLKGRFFWSKRTGDGCHRAIELFRTRDRARPALCARLRRRRRFVGHARAAGRAHGRRGAARDDAARQGRGRTGRSPSTLRSPRCTPRSARSASSTTGIWPAAERAFQRSLSINPNYLNARHWYAMALSQMQRHDEALAEMARALHLDPVSLYVNANYGRLLYFARRYDEAVAHMERTLELDPSFAFTRFRMGLAYEGAGRLDRAIDEYRLAQSFSNGGPLATASLGFALGAAGHITDARAVLDELLALSARRYVSAGSIRRRLSGTRRARYGARMALAGRGRARQRHRRDPDQPALRRAEGRSPLRPAGRACLGRMNRGMKTRSRRTFLKNVAAGAAGGMLLPSATQESSQARVTRSCGRRAKHRRCSARRSIESIRNSALVRVAVPGSRCDAGRNRATGRARVPFLRSSVCTARTGSRGSTWNGPTTWRAVASSPRPHPGFQAAEGLTRLR
jgi:tetratricopeptide (TPR) repeat protein